jgi:Domain of unknown function (DUF5606)
MEYNKIVAVTGLPGLFELISSKTDGAIVKSLEDKSTKFAAARIHNFSHLESIEVFTNTDNVNLVDVFTLMDKSKEKLPDEKDGAAVKKYFEKVYADMDFERVYSSDMKKMVKWFGILKANDIEIKLTEAPEEEPVAEEVKEVKPQVKKEIKEIKEAGKEVKKGVKEVKETKKEVKKEVKKAAKEEPAEEAKPKKTATKKKTKE